MARKIASAPAVSEARADTVAEDVNELYTLVPDVTLEIAGRSVTLKEYRFIDGLHARAKAAALIEDLDATLGGADVADASIEAYLDISARHDALVLALMVDSIEGADADWIDSLSGDDGQRLLVAWWEVTGRFFWRAAVRRQVGRMLAQHRRKMAASAGSTSSPTSPPPDTATSPASGSATQSVN